MNTMRIGAKSARSAFSQMCNALRTRARWRAPFVRHCAFWNTARDVGLQTDFVSAISKLLLHTSILVGSDRCTLFLVDRTLAPGYPALGVPRAGPGGHGVAEIRVPISEQSVVGCCALSGAVVSVPDAYADARFDRAFDAITGYRTHSILAAAEGRARGRRGRAAGAAPPRSLPSRCIATPLPCSAGGEQAGALAASRLRTRREGLLLEEVVVVVGNVLSRLGACAGACARPGEGRAPWGGGSREENAIVHSCLRLEL